MSLSLHLYLISIHPNDILSGVKVDIQREDESHVLVNGNISCLFVPDCNLIGSLWRARVFTGLCTKINEFRAKIKCVNTIQTNSLSQVV